MSRMKHSTGGVGLSPTRVVCGCMCRCGWVRYHLSDCRRTSVYHGVHRFCASTVLKYRVVSVETAVPTAQRARDLWATQVERGHSLQPSARPKSPHTHTHFSQTPTLGRGSSLTAADLHLPRMVPQTHLQTHGRACARTRGEGEGNSPLSSVDAKRKRAGHGYT